MIGIWIKIYQLKRKNFSRFFVLLFFCTLDSLLMKFMQSAEPYGVMTVLVLDGIHGTILHIFWDEIEVTFTKNLICNRKKGFIF